MHLVMLDIDGTLIQSNHIEAHCFISAVQDTFGITEIPTSWDAYEHVTDKGIAHYLYKAHFGKPPTDAALATLKACFLSKLHSHLQTLESQIAIIAGAQSFINNLHLENVAVSIATGSYQESAHLKLKTAGLKFEHLPMSSCDDSHVRAELMRDSENKAKDHYQVKEFESVTYIGDGIWDYHASQICQYRFIGIRDHHHQTLDTLKTDILIFNDFLEIEPRIKTILMKEA